MTKPDAVAAAVEHGMVKVNAPTKEEMFQYSPYELVGHHAASHAYDSGYRAALRAAVEVCEKRSQEMKVKALNADREGRNVPANMLHGWSDQFKRLAKRIAAPGVTDA